jgi:hypothetical protein
MSSPSSNIGRLSVATAAASHIADTTPNTKGPGPPRFVSPFPGRHAATYLVTDHLHKIAAGRHAPGPPIDE